jgi:dTDP-4-amino-4,6-dideoxygalactose transaminase
MKKIQFVENKHINFNNLKKLYKFSVQKNHHTNFGPISQKLEKYIHKKIKLPKNKTVIACSSSTSAILIIAKYLKTKNKNRFATSNFTFFSNYIDDLKSSLIFPTNENCSIDLDIIKKNLNNFDNLIFTNCFNFNYDYEEIYKICKKNKKNLIIDNATGFYERPNNYNYMDIFETISFHHTKPCGFGEGGVIICNKKHESSLRNLINFGVKNFKKNHQYGLNAKISDISCAVILLRLKSINMWSKQYLFQRKRVLGILCKNFNFKKIFYKNNRSPLNYIAVMFNKPIDFKKIYKSKKITFNKYYIPLKKNKILNCKANTIYNHILCIPVHPGLKRISDKEIIKDIQIVTN